MQQQYIAAYEIGSSRVKGAIGLVDGTTGKVEILAVEQEKLLDKVRYGIVENPAEVAAAVSAVNRRLQARPTVSPRVVRQGYVGISGRSVMSSTVEVGRDLGHETEITRAIVEDLAAAAARRGIEGRDTVAVTPGTYEVDSKSVAEPVGTFGHDIKATMNIITCRTKLKNNLRRVFNERCNLKIASWSVTPLAIASQVLTDEDRRRGVVLVDLGAETTTVVIFKDGIMHRLVTIPMGGRLITRDLMSLGILEEQAENIKTAVADSFPAEGSMPIVTDGLESTDINDIVAARAHEIISNILEQIERAGFKAEALPAGMVVTGGTTRLRGFNALLARQGGMQVRQAALPPTVAAMAPDIIPADYIDVISLVADAASRATECTELPPVAVNEVERHEDNTHTPAGDDGHTPAGDDTRHTNRHSDDISRIGTYCDGDDSDLLDDLEPDELPVNKKDARKDAAKETKKVSKQESKEVKDGKNPAKRSFWEQIRENITRVMNDENYDNL